MDERRRAGGCSCCTPSLLSSSTRTSSDSSSYPPSSYPSSSTSCFSLNVEHTTSALRSTISVPAFSTPWIKSDDDRPMLPCPRPTTTRASSLYALPMESTWARKGRHSTGPMNPVCPESDSLPVTPHPHAAGLVQLPQNQIRSQEQRRNDASPMDESRWMASPAAMDLDSEEEDAEPLPCGQRKRRDHDGLVRDVIHGGVERNPLEDDDDGDDDDEDDNDYEKYGGEKAPRTAMDRGEGGEAARLAFDGGHRMITNKDTRDTADGWISLARRLKHFLHHAQLPLLTSSSVSDLGARMAKNGCWTAPKSKIADNSVLLSCFLEPNDTRHGLLYSPSPPEKARLNKMLVPSSRSPGSSKRRVSRRNTTGSTANLPNFCIYRFVLPNDGYSDKKRAKLPRIVVDSLNKVPDRKEIEGVHNATYVGIVFCDGLWWITSTDLCKIVKFRLEAAGFKIINKTKLFEGVYSDLRLVHEHREEEPGSNLLTALDEYGCLSMHKRQKVYQFQHVKIDELLIGAIRRELAPNCIMVRTRAVDEPAKRLCSDASLKKVFQNCQSPRHMPQLPHDIRYALALGYEPEYADGLSP